MRNLIVSRALKQYYEYKTKNHNHVGECLLCRKKYNKNIEIKMKNRNTSGLKRHLQSKHRKEFASTFPESVEKGGIKTFLKSARQVGENSDFTNATIDWICLTYQPLSFFDNEATIKFMKLIAPQVQFPSKTTLTRNIKLRFEELQGKLKDKFSSNTSKISFTIDGWTSIASRTYYGITAHFIDSEWNYQSTVIDFVPSHGKHSGADIACIFKGCIEIFDLTKKIQGITVDNASANTTFMLELSNLLPQFNESDQHFRCMAHILNLGVQSLMKTIALSCENDCEAESDSEEEEHEIINNNSNSIMKIRSVFSKIRRSEVMFNKFRSACETAGIDICVKPILDCPTRWNSTHDMVGVALKMKDGISTICNVVEELKKFSLTAEEWDILQNVYKFLINFKKISTILGGEKYVTLPLVIPAFNLLIDKIEEKLIYLQNRERTIDTDLAQAFQSARDKMLKHYKRTNWIYCITLILDPRHKLEVFNMSSWGREIKENTLNKFKSIFQSYSPGERVQTDNHPQNLSHMCEEEEGDMIDFAKLYEKPSTSTAINNQVDELQIYLSEERANYNVNILQWWKLHECRFPRLAIMARDFLAIPATSVPAERLFSRASLTMRKHRNRLSNQTARWLLCINNWDK